MQEPTLDHRETWEDFYTRKLRQVQEIEIAMESMPWWEHEEARRELSVLWFELETAGRMMDEKKTEDG